MWKCTQISTRNPSHPSRPLPKSTLSSKIIRAPLSPKAQCTGGPVAGTTQSTSPIAEIDVLWITAGLGCDGDTIAMTAATQPSIEDIVLGGMPWIPKVNFHNPFLSLRKRRRIPARASTSPPRAVWIPSSWSSRAPSPTKKTRQKATGHRSAPTQQPASPLPPASGSTASPRAPGQ